MLLSDKENIPVMSLIPLTRTYFFLFPLTKIIKRGVLMVYSISSWLDQPEIKYLRAIHVVAYSVLSLLLNIW